MSYFVKGHVELQFVYDFFSSKDSIVRIVVSDCIKDLSGYVVD